MFQLTYRSR